MKYDFVEYSALGAVAAWPMAESFVKESLAQEEHTLLNVADIRQGVYAGRMVLWLIYKEKAVIGAFVTQIEAGGNGRGVNVVCLGGEEMIDWIDDFSEEMVSYAKRSDCRYVFELGRPGWTKILARAGWVDAKSRIMLKMVA